MAYRVAVVGGSGYTGGELLRLLAGHPSVRVAAVTSERSAGKRVEEVFPNLRGFVELLYEPLDPERIAKAADLVFLALPHKEAMDAAAVFHARGKKVVDLSADFRLRDPKLYEQWYGTPHRHVGLLKQAVYGLPEIHRQAIRSAALVGNPGCYPTAALLGLLPLLTHRVADPQSLIVDAKSGVTGAGRGLALPYHFPEAHDGLAAYKVGGHRHLPEMVQEIEALAEAQVNLTFTPHLVPMDRGILATIYATLTRPCTTADLADLARETYAGEPFVQVLPPGELPNVKHLRGTNLCRIGLHAEQRTHRAIVVAAIDNLVKGAAGQAIQNMNLMLGLEETAGLLAPGFFP
jgi:N-acetyl-gamma-glutamyl-phosphate reductase